MLDPILTLLTFSITFRNLVRVFLLLISALLALREIHSAAPGKHALAREVQLSMAPVARIPHVSWSPSHPLAVEHGGRTRGAQLRD